MVFGQTPLTGESSVGANEVQREANEKVSNSQDVPIQSIEQPETGIEDLVQEKGVFDLDAQLQASIAAQVAHEFQANTQISRQKLEDATYEAFLVDLGLYIDPLAAATDDYRSKKIVEYYKGVIDRIEGNGDMKEGLSSFHS